MLSICPFFLCGSGYPRYFGSLLLSLTQGREDKKSESALFNFAVKTKTQLKMSTLTRIYPLESK
jgi:hypothetical protein